MSAGLTFDTKNVVNSADAAISKIDKLTDSIENLDKAANGVRVPPIEIKAALDHLELSKNIKENVARAQAGLPPVIIDGYVKVKQIKKADNPADYENILANSPGYKKVNQHSATVAVNQAEALTKQVYKAVEVTQTFSEVWKTAFSLPPNAQRVLMGDVKNIEGLSKAVTDYGTALKNLSTGDFTNVKKELGQAQGLFEARRQLGPMNLGEISMSQTSGALLGVRERLQIQEGKDTLAVQKATLAQRETFFKANRDLEAGDVKAMQAYIRKLQGLQTMLSQVSAENKDWMVSNLSRKHGTDVLANLDVEIPRLQKLVAVKQAEVAAVKKSEQDLNKLLGETEKRNKFEAALADASLAAKEGNFKKIDKLLRDLRNIQSQYEAGGMSPDALKKLSDRYGEGMLQNLDAIISNTEKVRAVKQAEFQDEKNRLDAEKQLQKDRKALFADAQANQKFQTRLYKAEQAALKGHLAPMQAMYRELLAIQGQIDQAPVANRAFVTQKLGEQYGKSVVSNLEGKIKSAKAQLELAEMSTLLDKAEKESLTNSANNFGMAQKLDSAKFAARKDNLQRAKALLEEAKFIEQQYNAVGDAESRKFVVDKFGQAKIDFALDKDGQLSALRAVVAEVEKSQAKIKQAQGLNAFQKIEGDLVSSKSLESLDRLGVTLKNLKRDFESGIDTSKVYSGRWAKLAQADVERLLARYNELRMQRTVPVPPSTPVSSTPSISPPLPPDSVRTANQLASAFDHLEGSTHSLHSAFRGLASGFNLMWLTWGEILPLLAGAAVSMGLTEVVKQGKEFETTLYRLANLADITGESLQSLKKTFYEMGDSTIYSAQQAAEAATILGLAGLKGKEVEKALRPTLAFAAAGEVTTEKAAEVLTAVGTAYAYAANSYSVVSDVIMKAAADSITSVDEMAESFKTASVLAQTYGVSLQDTAYALQGLAQIGITGSAAGTSLRNMYQELTKTSGAVGKVMKDLGVSAVESTGEMRGLLDIVTDLQMGLINLTGSEQNRYKAIISNERGNKALSASLADFNKEYKAYVATLSAADQALVNHGKTQQADLARKDAVIAASQKLRARLAQEFASAQGVTFFAGLEKSLTTAGKFDGITASFKNGLLMAFDSAQPALNAFALSLRDLFKSSEVREGFSSFITGIVRVGSATFDWLRTLGPVVTGVKEFGQGLLNVAQTFGQGLLNVAQTFGQILSPLVSMASYIVALISPFNELSTQLAALAVGYVLWSSSIVRLLGVLALQTGGLIAQGVALTANTLATVANGTALSATTAAKAVAHRVTGAYASGLALLTGQTTAATLASMRHSGALTAVGAAARVAATGVVAFGMALSVASVVGMVASLVALASSYFSVEDAATQARKAAEQDAEDRAKNLKLQMEMGQDMINAEINSNKVKLDELKKGSTAEETATRVLGAQVIERIKKYYDQIEALRSLRKEMELNNLAQAEGNMVLHGQDPNEAFAETLRKVAEVEAKYAEMTRRNTTARNRAVADAQIDIDTLIGQTRELAFLSDQASKAARQKPQGIGEGSVKGGKQPGGASRVPRTRDFDLQFEKDHIAAIKSSNDKQLAILKSGYDLQLDVAQASYDAGLSSFAQYQFAVSDLTQKSEAERLAMIGKAEDKAQAEAQRAHDQSLKIFEKELAEFKGTAQEKADYREKLGQKYVNNYTQIEQNLTSATESAEQQRVEITNDATKRRTLAYYKFMGEVGKVIKENQTFWQQDANEWAKADAMKALGDQFAYVSDQSTYSAQAEKAAATAKAEAFYKYQGEAIRLNEELKKLTEQEELLLGKTGELSDIDLKDMANLTIGKARLSSQLQRHSEQSAEATAKAAEKAYQQVQEGAVINLQNATTDAIMNGILNGGEAAKKSLRAILVAELMKPVRMVVQAMVNPVVGAVAGAFGIGTSPTAAMAGQAGSSMLTSAATSVFSPITNTLAGWGDAFLAGLNSTLGTSLGASSAASYASSLGISATGQQAAMLASQTAGMGAGAAGSSSLMSSIGATAPWLLGGLAVLNVLGAFRQTKKVGGGLTGTLGDTGKISDYDLMRKSGTLLSGPDYSARISDSTSVLNDRIQSDWKMVSKSTLDLATSLGLSTEAAKDFTTALGTDVIHPDLGTKGIKLDDLMGKGLTDQQYAAEVNKRISDALLQGSNELAERILGSWQTTSKEVTEVIQSGDTEVFITKVVTDSKYVQSEFAKLGETAIQTLTRLASSLSTANTLFGMLGMTMYESSLTGADKASKFADSFGGADKFKEKVDAFVQVAFTPLEQAVSKIKGFGVQVKALGLSAPISARAVRELVKAQDLNTESGRDMAAKLIEIAPGMDAAMDQMLQSVGVNAADLSSVFSDGILKGYNPAQLGEHISGLLVANIEKALIENASKQIFDIITKDIIYPMIRAYLAGDAVTAAVTDGAINRAMAIANAYASLLKSDSFKQLLGDVTGLLTPLLADLGTTFSGTATHANYLTSDLSNTGGAASTAASDLEKVTDEFDKLRTSLQGDYLELLKTSLVDAGKVSEAHAVSLQQATLAEADFLAQNSKYSKEQQDELLILYRRNEAMKLSNQLQRAKLDLDSEHLQAQHDYSVEVGDLKSAHTVALQLETKAEQDFLAAHVNLTDAQREELLVMFRRNRLFEAVNEQLRVQNEQLATWYDNLVSLGEAVSPTMSYQTKVQKLSFDFSKLQIQPDELKNFPVLEILRGLTPADLPNLNTSDVIAFLNELQNTGGVSISTRNSVMELGLSLLELGQQAQEARNTLSDSVLSFAKAVNPDDTHTLAMGFERAAQQLQALGFTSITATGLMDAGVQDYVDSVRDIVAYDGWSDETKTELIGIAQGLVDLKKAARNIELNKAKENTDAIIAHLEKLTQTEIDAIKKRQDVLKDTVSNLESIFKTLKDSVASLRREAESTKRLLLDQARAKILEAATTKVLPSADDLSSWLADINEGLNSTVYTSVAESDYERLVVANELDRLKVVAGDQLTEAQQQLKLLEGQVKVLEDQLTAQRDILKATRDGAESITDKLSDIPSTLAALNAANARETALAVGSAMSIELTKLNLPGILSQILAQAVRPQLEPTPITAPAQQPAQLGAAPVRKISVDTGLQSEALALLDAQGPKAVYDAIQSSGYSLEQAESLLGATPGSFVDWAKDNNLPAFAVGTNYVPRDMVALLHEGEAVVPKRYNPALTGGSSPDQEEVLLAVRRLTEEVVKVLTQVKRTADAVNGRSEAPQLVKSI